MISSYKLYVYAIVLKLSVGYIVAWKKPCISKVITSKPYRYPVYSKFCHGNLCMQSEGDEEVQNIYKAIKSVTFISSNQNKIKEVKRILGEDFPWQVHCESFDLEEPQANAIEISIAKCKQAARICNGPVIVEDTSLCFNALGGLPGPYIKWFYESIGSHGIAKLLDGFDDKSAFAQCVVSFTLGKDSDIKTFVGATDGTIVTPTGPQRFSWDPVFKPLGSNQTFAEMGPDEKNKISHRFKAFREFKAYINSRTDM